jgi:hypothetical protein
MSKSMLPNTMAVINSTGTAHGRAITDINHAEPQQWYVLYMRQR